MRGWKNALINLLNIAGTGPIFGPIQGILFGPIAFITIPITNIIGGAMHDYFSGMICLRDGGSQMASMIRKYSNKGRLWCLPVFCSLLLLLVGAVFIYTPGDIAATQVFGFDGKATSVSTWVIYGVIFVYYLIATPVPHRQDHRPDLSCLRRDPAVLCSWRIHRPVCQGLSPAEPVG